MIPSISEIKIRRKTAGLTQAELAKASGVSQSLIAKIESGKTEPSFEKAKRLFDTLDKAHGENVVTASDLMRRHVFYVSPKDSVKKVVLLMEKRAISQVPVIDREKPVGTVTEKSILSKLGRVSDAVDLGKMSVSEIVEEAMPLIQETTPAQIVSTMLTFQNGLLVGKRGKITGIITKSDLLKIVSKAK
ncbi:MAG: CBS domain-containing protein [Candidatus Diapherotrites archaeon]|nr:CBS domain-containing protein [Candidatus Diapherotrites archaeon]